MKFALVGRPNCGKSTLFNQVAGYRAETGNFHGTTVTFTESRVRVAGQVIELVDLPGTYTLAGSNPAEAVAKDYLLSNDVDVIINVADASHLAQSLELTLELLTINRPVILAMNMMDEAMRMGLKVNGPGLEQKLGIKVVPLIASKGRGVKGLFLAGLEAAKNANHNERLSDTGITAIERHHMGIEIASEFVVKGSYKLSWRDTLDDLLLHPVWGYFALLLILLGFFQAVYGIGQFIEPPLIRAFDQLIIAATQKIGAQTFWGVLISGVLTGITAGIAIVLPYLLPFLLGLGLLEDIGYLPRVAFLMDALMHRIGLHCKA
ncbi:MAG: FeoB small GTPase domain-containing protein, partial [Chloroflexota bacterium]